MISSVDAGSSSDRPSDAGLAGERTTLAWSRMGLTLLGLPTALLAYSAARDVVAFAAAGASFVLGLIMLVVSLRRHRVTPETIPSGQLRPAGSLVLLTAASVLMLELSGAILVLG